MLQPLQKKTKITYSWLLYAAPVAARGGSRYPRSYPVPLTADSRSARWDVWSHWTAEMGRGSGSNRCPDWSGRVPSAPSRGSDAGGSTDAVHKSTSNNRIIKSLCAFSDVYSDMCG